MTTDAASTDGFGRALCRNRPRPGYNKRTGLERCQTQENRALLTITLVVRVCWRGESGIVSHGRHCVNSDSGRLGQVLRFIPTLISNQSQRATMTSHHDLHTHLRTQMQASTNSLRLSRLVVWKICDLQSPASSLISAQSSTCSLRQ